MRTLVRTPPSSTERYPSQPGAVDLGSAGGGRWAALAIGDGEIMPVTVSTPTPRLANHVRACVVGDQMIFLDMQRNKYVGVGGSNVPALSAAVLGTSQGDHAPPLPSSPEVMNEWLSRLRSQKLLSDTGDHETMKRPTLIEPIAGLDTEDVRSDGHDWRHLVRLWQSTSITTAWLRRHTLADIADRVVYLRERRSNCRFIDDLEAMRVAVGTYLRLRPFALSTHDRCLNDSLTLVHFLASHGLFPRWVIGVSVNPFCAHSWVQSGSVVLNDAPERVRRYRPILVV